MTVAVILTGFQGQTTIAPNIARLLLRTNQAAVTVQHVPILLPRNAGFGLRVRQPSISFAEFVTPDLIIETGEIVPNADSFVSLAQAEQFFRQSGIVEWLAASPETRKRCLREAARYLGFAYRWIGTVRDPLQSLVWPREGHNAPFPFDSVPPAVRQAQIMLAGEALRAPLGVIEDEGRVVSRVSERLEGVGGTDTTYEVQARPLDSLKRYPKVEAVLGGLITGPVAIDAVVAIRVRS